MSAALNNAVGVIDFVDTTPASAVQAMAGMVVGGPPAYLEAHGIRYVPSTVLDAGVRAESIGSDVGVRRAVEPAAALDAEPVYVSQREVDARVDERIQQFMRGPVSQSGRRGGRALQATADATDAAAAAAAATGDDVRSRLKALRDECESSGLSSSASVRVLRSGRRVAAAPPDYDY